MPETTQNAPPQQAPPYYEDEISLVDLAVSLWQHKWIIVGVTVLCTLIGLVYALSRERIYEYTTTIEIGTHLVEGQPQAIEPSHNVVAKLENSYVPEAIRVYQGELRQQNGNDHRLSVEVRTPRDTDLVILSSRAPEELGRYYIPLQNRIINHLREDHGRTTETERIRIQRNLDQARRQLAWLDTEASLQAALEPVQRELQQARVQLEELEDERVQRVARKSLENRIAAARNELESLRGREALIREEIENLVVKEELVTERLAELREFIREARARRPDTVDQTATGTDGMALMLIDTEIQRDIDRMNALEERLTISIPERRSSLRNTLEDNQRAQALQQEEIDRLDSELEKLQLDQERALARHRPRIQEFETRITKILNDHQRQLEDTRERIEELKTHLANVRETRAILPPRQSLGPVGTRRARIVALSVILGGMLGLFAVGLMILAKSTRERLNQQSAS